MPMARYQIRNEYSLADPELYRAADKDDPEALLEGVAMAGLVGVLRQLGDLAQFAAEIFHDLHEEVLATAARGHGLMARVQQLEAEVPSLEKAFLSQTHHSSFFSNGGFDWHPNLRSEQNLIARGDLPRFVMDLYEECRGPPRLFLLDKFDVAGAGACLKRYTDPSFFKLESASSGSAVAGIHREKRMRKVKKKAARLKNGETPEVAPTHAKLHQLFLEERIENVYSDPARLVKLKKRQLNGSAVEAKTGKSYMEKFVETPSPDYKMVCETSIIPLPVKPMLEDTNETGIKILEISTVSPVKRSLGNESTCSSPNEQEPELKLSSEMERETDGGLLKVPEQMLTGVADELSYNYIKAPDEKELAADGQKKLEASLEGYHSDDVTSEVDNFLDALTTMDSEMETDNDCRPKNSIMNIQKLTDSGGQEEQQLQDRFSYSQSSGDSSTSDEINSFKKERTEDHTKLQAGLSNSQSIRASSTWDKNSSFKSETTEEHMELQVQFSDSLSVGNSSASDEISVFKKDRSCFSHSDSSSIVGENVKSEPILIPPSQYCESEIEDTSSSHLPQIVELQKTDINKFVKHDDTHFQEDEIYDSRRTSSSSCLVNSGLIFLCSDHGANSPMIQPTGTQLVETASDTVEIHSSLADDDDRKQSTAAVPDDLSMVKDDACPLASSGKYPSNNTDDGDPYVQSNASLQILNDLELAPVIVPKGTQLVETPSDPIELHSSLADDKERKCYIESLAVVPDALSIMKDDDACPAVSSENYPLNNLDDGGLYVHSDASLQISNEIELAPMIVPTVTRLVETPSEPFELHSNLADEEERKCHVESIAAVPNALSVTEDGALPVISSKGYPLSKLDDGDSYIHSNASLQISNDLNLAPEDERSNHSEIKVLQAGFANENSAEILVSREVSPHGEHPIQPFMKAGSILPLDGLEGLDSKAEDYIIATKLKSEDSSPAVETSPARSLTREQFSDFTHDSPQDELDSAGVEALYSDQLSNIEEISRIKHDVGKSGSNCTVDAVEDDGHLKNPSSPGYVGQENHVMVNDDFTEKAESEDQAVSAAFVDSAENRSIVTCPPSDMISSSSRNLANLEEPIRGPSDSHQSEMESNEAESAETLRDLNAEIRKKQLEPSSDLIASNIISSSMRAPTDLEESLSSFRDPCENEMKVNEAVARESLTELKAQKVVDQPEVASADVLLSLKRSVSCDLSDSEIYNSIQDSSLEEQSQYIPPANNVKAVPEFSELGTKESESLSLCQNDSLSSSYHQLESETPSDEFLQSQAGQQDAEFLLRAEENSVLEKLQSEHMHVSNQLELEISSHAASESALEMHLDQPLSESLSQSAGQEINPTKYVMDPLKAPLPDHFPKASEINLEEMPPMPPLPPMQWRMGKFQHASPASQRELVEVSLPSFQPTQAIKTDEKCQFGLLTSERENLQYQNPFLPVMAVEGDKIQYTSGFPVGVSGHPVAIPLQFPFMVNEANGQYNYLVLERSQIQNPFLTLPVVSTGRPPHGYIVASEGETVQYSNPCSPLAAVECAISGHDSVAPQGKLTQPPSQLMAETSLEAKTLQHSLSNMEGEQEDPSVTSMPPPSKKIVESNHNLQPSEGEIASPLDISAPTSDFECEKPNGIPKNKLPRPRSPLIDAVAAHDKSKLRKVSQRARPETAPKIDERDSLLEQIRTKSFNLKPSVATRPSIQGPKTNLKVAAILEKANAIRQALAGSDEDDDNADSWSDS